MSKKKKNSNYKGTPDTSGVPIKKKPEEGKNKAIDYKKWTIIALCAVLVVGLIVGIAACTASRTALVELDFGEYGKVVIEVDKKAAPKTAKNFLDLVNDDFYDGLTIFRAQQNFVIQGGKNDAVKLEPIVGEFAENGHKNPISHERGVISMARTSDPNSATSQFFITLHDNAAKSLDGKYAAFGRVASGMDVVDAIAEKLFSYPSDSMGFVSEAYAIKIVSAKVID
jgi:peptidyl-prolyl cis-trans isomerase B (cyclophilin B)